MKKPSFILLLFLYHISAGLLAVRNSSGLYIDGVKESSSYTSTSFTPTSIQQLPLCFKNPITNATELNAVITNQFEYFSIKKYTINSNDVYVLYNYMQNPEVCYFGLNTGKTTVEWECNPVHSFFNRDSWTCETATFSSRTYNETNTENGVINEYPKSSIEIEVNSDTARYKNVAITRSIEGYTRISGMKTAMDSNADRKRINFDIVEHLYNLGYCATFLLIVITCFWLSWCCPCSQASCCREQCETQECLCSGDWWDFGLWFFGLIIPLFLGSFVRSLVIMCLLFMILLLYSMTMALVYCCYLHSCCCAPGKKYCMCCELVDGDPTHSEKVNSPKRAASKEIPFSNLENPPESRELEMTEKRKPSDNFDEERAVNSSDEDKFCYACQADDQCYWYKCWADCCTDDDCKCHCSACPECAKRIQQVFFDLGHCPVRLEPQHRFCIDCFNIFMILFFISGVIAFFAWDMKNYYIYDRVTGETIVEFVPDVVEKGLNLLYARDNKYLTGTWDQWAFDVGSDVCGSKFDKKLETDADKMSEIQVNYIDKYSINMSMYKFPTYDQYDTVNAWFRRELKPNTPGVKPVRPINSDVNNLLSPADCRLNVFEQVPPDQKVWIKSEQFNLKQFLDYDRQNSTQQALISHLVDGSPSMFIFRLAPQDYHRYHTMTDSKVLDSWLAGVNLHSVNMDGMTSGSLAIYNKRFVTIHEDTSGKIKKPYAYVIIGAMCTGSISLCKNTKPVQNCKREDPKWNIGQTFNRGENFGFFEFGGSTVVAVMPNNSVAIDQDLVVATGFPVETLVQQGTSIGKIIT